MSQLVVGGEVGIASQVMIGVLQELGCDFEVAVDGTVFILEGMGEHPIVGLIAVEEACKTTMIDARHAGVDKT